MKRIYFGLFLVFTSLSTMAQYNYQTGVIRGTSNDNTSITRMEFDNYDYQVIFGKFYDSVHVEPFSETFTLIGGSSASGVHNAYFAVYDPGGYVDFAHALGNTTDSVTIKGAALDYSGNLIVGGSFKGTVDFADNAGSPFYLTSLGTGYNGFVAMYDYNGALINAFLLENSTGNSQVNDILFNGSNDIVAVGQFSGTVDLDPSGANANYTATGIDGFVVTFSSYLSGYYSSTAITGTNNQIPTAVECNWADLIISGHFSNQINLDLSGGSNIAASNGAKDLFVIYCDYAYIVSNYMTMGGAGNDYVRDLLYDNSTGYIALIEFEQTVNFDPEFGVTNKTSAGLSDVAIARYDNTFSLGYVKQFGNTNADKAYRLVMNSGPSGGRGGPPPVGPDPADHFMFSMGYSGTVDFNPEPADVANSTSSNTALNSAIVNLDSSGVYVFHGSIEASSIVGLKPTGMSGNNMIIAGNFAGTNVDMLVYADTSTLDHSGVKSGFYVHYDRCQMTHLTPEIAEPFECTGCNAKLQMQVTGGVLPLHYYWNNGDYYSYEEIATDVCADNSNKFFVDVNDFYGCYVGDTLWVRTHPSGFELDAVINVTSTSCGNNLGSADATPVNALGTVSYNWSNGSVTSTADSLEAGNYFVQIIDDSLFCYYEKGFTIDNSDGPVITVDASTDPACGNVDNGTINVTVTGGAAPYTYLWTNGATTEDLSGLGGGTYTLTVTDASGCENTVCVSLYQPSELNTYKTNTYYSSCNFNDGTLEIESSGGYSPYTYQWDANAGSSTNDTVNNLFAGIYNVTVTDSLGCTANFNFGISDGGWWSPYISYDYINNPDCFGNTGYIDLYTEVYSPMGILNFLWDSGETTENLANASSGTHFVKATDDNGCVTVGEFWVYQELPEAPTVCMVTVDSTGTQNVVVWDKSTTPQAEYYNIYREGLCNQNDFGIVGSMDFDSLSVFYDTVVNSDTRTWRYYVTAVDTCGFESDGSVIHRTIHLTSSVDVDTNIVLDWSDYQGMQILGYKIYRRQPLTLMYDFVDSVGALTTNYLDTIDFNAYPDVEYFVDAIPASVCSASRAYNQNEARSNHTKSLVPHDTSTLSLPEVFMESSIELYPNPSNDLVSLKVNSKNANWKMQMMDQTGRVVMSGNVRERAAFSTRDIAAGVYFIRMTSDTNEIQTLKLLIVH